MKKILRKVAAMACCALMPMFGYAQLGEDVTSLLADPAMDDLNAWTNNGFKSSSKGDNYKPMFGKNFIEQWTSSKAESTANLGDISIEQSLADLPNGAYLFSAACIACQQGDESIPVEGAFLYANDSEASVVTGNGTPERFYVMAVVADGNLTVGFKTVSTSANWLAWDNARLRYYTDASVDASLAVAMLSLQDAMTAGEAYSDTIKMQISAFAALSDAIAVARDLVTNGGSADAAIAAREALEAAMSAADASIAAYESLIGEIADAQEVFDTYVASDDAEFVVNELDALQNCLNAANAVYSDAASDTAAVNAQIVGLSNASAAVVVGVEIYLCLDSLDNILGSCEIGTSYGCFTQAWMDRVEELSIEMNNYYLSYKDGGLTAAEMLPHIENAYAVLANFWASMIVIDFSLPLNSRLFPYSADIDEEAFEHDLLFMGDEGPWSFGELTTETSITYWTLENASYDDGYSEDGKGTANGILTWHDNVPTSWHYVRTDGLAHGVHGKPLVAIFTASADAVFQFHATVSGQDKVRVDKNRGDLRSYAFFIQNGSDVLNQIGEPLSYNYGTDPADHRFYINMKAGDKIAITLADTRHSSNGNQLVKIDTLYALGSKDEENGYTKADAEASGLLFFNAYTPAEDWSALPGAIEKGRGVLAETKDEVGDGFAKLDSAAYAALDSVVVAAEKMLAAQLASQPDVDHMVKAVDSYIDALYASAGYAICLASEEFPVDSLVDFTDWQLLPDGLYYIQDATTGNYVTAPNSDSDKQSVFISPLIDETMSQQNAQVWHLAYADTCGAYAIGTYKNDGSTWTIEQETECGMSQNQGFYHIAENIQARTGSVHFVLDPASVLWRTFRIYFNGTRYCLVGGTGDFAKGWTNVMLPGADKAGRGNGAAFNFGWNLIPFDPNATPGEGVDNVAAPVVSVSYYNLMGVQVAQPEAGVAIKRVVRADGSIEAVKVLVK